ncbi:hypothetical protein KXD40_009359 [Peronospora effusa]|uniref:RXLR phytopathogen effector protein WY-domain domain-containing protein n=1 Tax=Peronospora effusa TaxID=542832 RepID=A0A425BX24_9STRA|nr:hypothetical protein DD237_008276 [Peronospora effusa]UIZ28463.1 hypothetical protein KXD40_009359 [Peronospora effusa]CAI5729875.1 unnamed protein product [Peronospora effusa]
MPTPLLNRLLKFYNVGDLAKAAVKVPNDEIALRVLKEIEADFLFRKYSPDDAFTKLRLEEDGDKLFDNRLFHFWTKYVIYYNSWVKQEADKVSMLSVLEKHFDQLTLLDQINIKQNSKITEHLMEELKGINMEDLAKAAVMVSSDEISWREFHEIEADFLFRNYSPDDAFTKLRLKEAGDKLFDKSLFRFWTKYVIYYNSWVKQEADKVSMLSVLEKHFDQLALLDQIKLKQNSDITKHLMEELKDIKMVDLAKAAVKVSNDETSRREFHAIEADFLFRKYSPDDAFTKLRLKKAGDKLFDNRLFHFWTKYVIYYNSWVKQEADKVSMLSVLEKHFDLLTLLDQIKLHHNSDLPKHLMEEIKDAGIEDLII